MQNTTLIILGHGSKSKNAIEDFNYIVKLVADKNEFKNVAGAHMEIADPSLQDVVKDLYEKGERDFVIFPYFLYNGMHIRFDIPGILEKLTAEYEGISFDFTAPIGQDPIMADLIVNKVSTHIAAK
ncbi:sirohydrochlorin chelatase [Saccharicrinis aurantiacus]|uniref:sirohydrochlorin chelatase n=1 Tax=Saccharicrinis aurantiacus TaxID=1849719 RepID=UPI00248F7561|nr:CbiX/SirB N-terminal domain-containing protein [Saccharicrinis aurantiacus]